MRSNASTMVTDIFLWLPTGFGTSICYETAVCFYKHSDGRTGGSCSVVLVVSPLVYLIGSHRRINTAATLQAVYLVWLFLRITTTCNLSIIGLVRKRFPESLAHAQTVDTRPLFPPPMWPGYEASFNGNSNDVCQLLCQEFDARMAYVHVNTTTRGAWQP